MTTLEDVFLKITRDDEERSDGNDLIHLCLPSTEDNEVKVKLDSKPQALRFHGETSPSTFNLQFKGLFRKKVLQFTNLYLQM